MRFDGQAAAAQTVTLAERKAAEAARLRGAAAEVVRHLAEHARRQGGRYLVFGSYPAGAMRFDSDLDILVDFPPETSAAAWRFAETVAAKHEVPLDLHDARTSCPDFVERVMRRSLALP